MKGITPMLWFDNHAQEAATFYNSIFNDSSMGETMDYIPEAAAKTGLPPGTPMTAEFELAGIKFTGLNGGPMFKFNEAVSFVVKCESQEEVDYYWSRLTADGGEESQCGWLKDKFGLSWQVTPVRLIELMKDSDPEKVSRVTNAMMQMKKINIADLEAAAQ
ncbi:MAG: VOC family protein [Pyrinomonadaceae bacterium]